MKIRYLGHSSFAITSSGGDTLVTDPYDSAIGFAMPRVRARAVTLSHYHYDHANLAAVEGKPRVLDGAHAFEEGDFTVRGISSFHDDAGGKKRGENVIFTIEADGIKVCHLGDLGEKFSEERVRLIGSPDVLLIPVGGNYTIDGNEAAKYAKAISPKIIIPMHYKVRGLKIDISGVEEFLSRYDGAAAERKGCEISLSSKDICGATTKIYLMERG